MANKFPNHVIQVTPFFILKKKKNGRTVAASPALCMVSVLSSLIPYLTEMSIATRKDPILSKVMYFCTQRGYGHPNKLMHSLPFNKEGKNLQLKGIA